MIRIAVALTFLMVTSANAQDNGCFGQVTWFVKNVPNLEKQTGIGSEEALIESPTRLLLVMSAFSHSLSQLQAKSPSKYWRSLLVVTDGLARCFEGDIKNYDGEQLASANAFHARFPNAERIRFVTNASKELEN